MASAMHISICGGGIGGLTLALVISKYSSLPVEIFEGGPTITTTGAGIGFFTRTMDIMKELGIYDELVQMAVRPPQENTGPTFRKSDGRNGYHWFRKELKRGPLSVHRKDVVDCLLRHIPTSCRIHTSKKLSSYDVNPENGKITLQFSDGSTTMTDVLVGADGIHSATRKIMYQKLAALSGDDDTRKKLVECIDPVWTGNLAYRYLIPTEKFLKEHPDVEAPTDLTMHIGKNKHIVTFPISQGRLINVVIFAHNSDAFGTPFVGPWVTKVSEREVAYLLEGWEPRANALAKCAQNASKWALHSMRPLPHYVDGRVALLGDAAHAMEPHFGAGAGQAIDDAFVLGRLLTHKLTNRGNVSDALKIYEDVRLPFANAVVQRTQNVGRYYGFQRVSPNGPVLGHDSPEELDYVRKSIEDAWEWQGEPARVWGEAEERWRAKYRMGVKLQC